MYGRNYHFFGEAAQTQANLIESINKDFKPPIPEINGGMCYMLAMQYLLDYLEGQMLPEQAFDRLTGNGGYLRQIAGNFRAYMQGRNPADVVADTSGYIDSLSRKKSEAKLIQRFDNNIPSHSIADPRIGHLIIIYFAHGAHAVAAVRDQDTYCLYDPNYGIYRTKNPNDIYTAVLPNLYSAILRGYLLSVNTK